MLPMIQGNALPFGLSESVFISDVLEITCSLPANSLSVNSLPLVSLPLTSSPLASDVTAEPPLAVILFFDVEPAVSFLDEVFALFDDVSLPPALGLSGE